MQDQKFNSRGGRPFDVDPRKTTFSTRLNRAETQVALERISATGMKKSEVLRLLLLNETLPTVIHKGIDITASQAYQNLQPLQSNLNQIAKELNSDRTAQFDQEGIAKIIQFVRKIEHEVKAIRQQIIEAQGAEA